MQLINTGIIIILVNANVKSVKDWSPNFPFFTGKYNDFEPDWYSDVGTTIIFSMILNIVTPHVANILFYYYHRCQKLFDRCCSKNKITSRLTKNDYFDLYIGPEFSLGSRYAEILATIFVVLIYSSGMPILYACCFFYFFITYWMDKWMILRFYRTPPHTDLYISNLFSQIVLVSIIVHLCVGIWIYGNKDIFPNSLPTFLDFISDFVKTNINNLNSQEMVTAGIKERLVLPHNILMLIVLSLLTFYFLWNLFLKNLLGFICCVKMCGCKCCGSKKKVQIINLLESKNFFNF